ncbi:AraC family transcriptional regulator [Shinella granuli]|nr:AraC family transcriptional regulator [Shinella granuli]
MEDPLSQFLSLVEARAVISTGLAARGLWAMHVPPVRALKCNMIKRGECTVETRGKRWRLTAGDCFLIGPELPFVIGTDLNRLPRHAAEVFAGPRESSYAQLDAGAGPDFLCLSGRMDLTETARFLTDTLPPIIVVRSDSPVAGRLHWLVGRLEDELSSNAPGSTAMARQIMQMIFIELLRNLPEERTGSWLAALSDPRIGAALRAIHDAPHRVWRLDELAGISHLSRSRFSARFRAAVGRAPMDYVLRWRMTLAQKALLQPDATIATIAAQFGYGSESAFIHAFRQATGLTPRQARQEARSKATDLPAGLDFSSNR